MKSFPKKINGYSLVEILVYLAIFVSVSILVINSFIIILNSFNITRVNRELLEGGSTAMERMSREIRQAVDVDISGSTLGSNPGVLLVDQIGLGGSGSNFTAKFMVSNGGLILYKDGTLVDNLVGQNVSVTNLIFRRIVTTSGEAVKIEMTLQDTRGSLTKSANFYDTVIMRSEY